MTKQNRTSNFSFLFLALVICLCMSWIWQLNGQEDRMSYAEVRQQFEQENVESFHFTDQHTLELHGGDVLQVHFVTEKGSLRLELKAPDGTAVYSGNGKETTDFTVNIPESGAYTIVVEARRAKGSVHVQLAGTNS